MAKLFASDFGCKGATLENGRSYNADRSGMVTVNDPRDIKTMVAGGYVVAGGLPRLSKFYVCECGWEAAIRHCPRCDRDDLTKVEK